MKKSIVIKPFIAGILAIIIVVGVMIAITPKKPSQTISVSPTPTLAVSSIQYAGENGIDALTLLKAKATVHESSPGFIDEINGKKAESSKHEYWAFYVNDKLANVGAGQYVTKDTDVLLWKIEKY